jgi:general L-amino acid transport system permease protein
MDKRRSLLSAVIPIDGIRTPTPETATGSKLRSGQLVFSAGVSKQALLWQVIFVVVLSLGAAWMLRNAFDNLQSRGVAAGFGFLWAETSLPLSETVPIPVFKDGATTALLGFIVLAAITAVSVRRMMASDTPSIPRSLGGVPSVVLLGILAVLLYIHRFDIEFITYTAPGIYGVALLTALMNTVKAAVVAIALCLIVGLVAGLCRLSANWLLSRLALVYIELMRNVPLLLLVFFWYFGVLRTLPNVRNSIALADLIFLSNRGVVLAQPVPASGTGAWLYLGILIAAGSTLYWRWRLAFSTASVRVALVGLLVAAVSFVGWRFGPPALLIRPKLQGFNFVGGITLTPEYAGLLIALVLYNGAFIAEIVRSAIQSVARGQAEAALSLGLNRGQVIRLVILPQARRVAIPPALSTCLGLIKDTSLGVAIGYPELVAVSGTILEVSGQVLEIILLIVVFYMVLTLSFSALVNWYNARIRVPGT